jgi:hypothetical protein
MAKLEIDARLLEPEGESPITENFNRVMKFIDNGGTGNGAEKTQVDFNATLENNVITCVLDESVSAMTGANLHLGISNSKLKSGTIVICTSNYENNGTTYSKGHQYLITSEFVSGELILSSEDITVVQTA